MKSAGTAPPAIRAAEKASAWRSPRAARRARCFISSPQEREEIDGSLLDEFLDLAAQQAQIDIAIVGNGAAVRLRPTFAGQPSDGFAVQIVQNPACPDVLLVSGHHQQRGAADMIPLAEIFSVRIKHF